MSNEQEQTGSERGRRKSVVGFVISDKMDKTITVKQERMIKHPLYGKYVKRGIKYKAHDEQNEARIGDQVEISFTRPISKSKNWRLVKVLRSSVLGHEEGPAS